MSIINHKISRRRIIHGALGALGAFFVLPHSARLLAQASNPIKKAIPSSGEKLPIIGMGTSRTFDTRDDAKIKPLRNVLNSFFEQGGAVIDSSPMYGAAEQTLGGLLTNTARSSLFSATKVWTDGKQPGIEQMLKSMDLWGVKHFDLMQIHNLRDWRSHLPVLKEWKQQGKIRYIGITTSHNRSHSELAEIMTQQPLDFVQFSYNIGNRVSEKTLLSVAADRGIATLINRPFQRGDLFARVKGKPLPAWAIEFDCRSWAQFFLKFIISHPAVTCAIPATSKPHHAIDNMQAGFGELPDAKLRAKMSRYFKDL